VGSWVPSSQQHPNSFRATVSRDPWRCGRPGLLVGCKGLLPPTDTPRREKRKSENDASCCWTRPSISERAEERTLCESRRKRRRRRPRESESSCKSQLACGAKKMLTFRRRRATSTTRLVHPAAADQVTRHKRSSSLSSSASAGT